ncbi:hypothetical protein OESDEN_21674 [Oesophagostomum dentatum]|uniref:Uncharacterized protein n=1 Tax=Oesophagostomum dentatum TaxID=61180 RepID=A0A0B1S057_OESDE|nr:hypothetical protein OESDEN_21674 [Oesophagostomum dentatum]
MSRLCFALRPLRLQLYMTWSEGKFVLSDSLRDALSDSFFTAIDRGFPGRPPREPPDTADLLWLSACLVRVRSILSASCYGPPCDLPCSRFL